MPTKEELADEAKVTELRQLAAENDVDLEGATTKDEIVAKITDSRKVTKESLEAVVGDGSDQVDKESGVKTSDTTAGLPAPIVDREAAIDRVEGRTSDASTHLEGTNVQDVSPDISDGPKLSDSGPDRYPFPPQGDVDVLTIPEVSRKTAKAEQTPPLHIGDTWVRLGKHKSVPDELVGHIAVVTDAPTKKNDDGADVADTSKDVTVRTRDEYSATVVVPYEALDEISYDGRHNLVSFA